MVGHEENNRYTGERQMGLNENGICQAASVTIAGCVNVWLHTITISSGV